MTEFGSEPRTVLITGAASGIGAAMVAAFLKARFRVAAFDVSSENLELLNRTHARQDILAIQGDIRVTQDVQSAVAATIENFGRIDALCNNAGIMDRFLLADEVTDEVWDKVIAVNLTGPMRLCRAVLPHMLAAGGGSIVNTSSIAGIRGGRAGIAYTSSKHGLIGLTRNIAASYVDQCIRCNAILPGSVETPMLVKSDPNDASNASFSQAGMAIREKVLSARPKPAQAQYIASVAVFLASPEAANVNGQAIAVDGGWTNQ